MNPHFMWLRPLLLWLCGLSETNSANLQSFPRYLALFKIFFVTSSLASVSLLATKYSLYMMLEFLPHRIYAMYENISSEYALAWNATTKSTRSVLKTECMKSLFSCWVKSRKDELNRLTVALFYGSCPMFFTAVN